MDRDTEETSRSGPPADNGPRLVRLLPWSTDQGKPCFLVSDAGGATDGGHSVLGRMADDLERMHLRHATVLLDRAGELIADQRADRRELRFLADQLRTSLREVTRIADSRGARLTAASGSDGTERTARDA